MPRDRRRGQILGLPTSGLASWIRRPKRSTARLRSRRRAARSLFFRDRSRRPAAGLTRRSHVFGAPSTSTRVDCGFVTRSRRKLNPRVVRNADAEAQALLDQLVALRPRQCRRPFGASPARRQTQRRTLLQDSVAEPGNAREQLAGCGDRARTRPATSDFGQDFPEAARSVAVLRNVLLRVPAFRELLAIRTPAELIAEPFDRFLRLPAPASKPSPPDAALAFSREFASVLTGPLRESALLAFSLRRHQPASRFRRGLARLRRVGAPGTVLPFPGGSGTRPPSANAVLAVDWNRDFRMDLVLAGDGGVRLFTQDADGTFRDSTAAAAGIDEAVSADLFRSLDRGSRNGRRPGHRGRRHAGPPLVLRNNGDGTWRRLQPFAGVVGLRGFARGDIDGDGDPDATLLDVGGDLHCSRTIKAVSSNR